jgi:hypothetical protein
MESLACDLTIALEQTNVPSILKREVEEKEQEGAQSSSSSSKIVELTNLKLPFKCFPLTTLSSNKNNRIIDDFTNATTKITHSNTNSNSSATMLVLDRNLVRFKEINDVLPRALRTALSSSSSTTLLPTKSSLSSRSKNYQTVPSCRVRQCCKRITFEVN